MSALGQNFGITVRLFYTSEEGVSAVPTATVTFKPEATSASIWDFITRLKAGMEETIKELPLSGVRPMTAEEIEDYLKEEEEDERAV